MLAALQTYAALPDRDALKKMSHVLVVLPADDVFRFHAIGLYGLCKGIQQGIWLFLLALGEQIGDGNSQGLAQEECFLVGDASDASLYLGQGSPGDVQADSLAFGRELILRKAELIPQPADLFSCDVRGQALLHFWNLTLEHYWN